MIQQIQLIVILLDPQSAYPSRMARVVPGDREAMEEAITLVDEYFCSESAGFISQVNPGAAQRSERSGEG